MRLDSRQKNEHIPSMVWVTRVWQNTNLHQRLPHNGSIGPVLAGLVLG